MIYIEVSLKYTRIFFVCSDGVLSRKLLRHKKGQTTFVLE